MHGGRYARVILTLLAVLAAVVLAQLTRPLVPAPRGAAYRPPRAGDADAALARPVAGRDLRGVGLGEAIDQLRAETGANLVVRWGMLKPYGVTPATPVRASLRGGTLASALTTVLRAADPVLLYGVEDGVITVTAGELPLAPIDVVDLRSALPAYEVPDPNADVPPPTVSGGLFASSPPPTAAQRFARLADSLIGPWDLPFVAGDFSERLFAGRLVVSCSAPGSGGFVRWFVGQLAAADGPATEPAPAAGTTRPAAPDRWLEYVLDERVPELRLEGVPFDKAVDVIRERWHVNIDVDWPRLKGTIAPDSTVNVRLWNVRLSQALSAVLDATAEGDAPVWFARDEFITITTTKGGGGGIVRVYDVRDLIAEATAYRKEHPQAKTEVPDATPDDGEGALLVKLVIDTLNVSDLSVHFWAGRLVVVDTPETGRKVEDLLAKLRPAARKP